MMGLEEHLIGMFRDDAEFNEARGAFASWRPKPQRRREARPLRGPRRRALRHWSEEAEKELKKIPFFVRGKARGNTEKFARERGLATITVGTLYDAKAHYGR